MIDNLSSEQTQMGDTFRGTLDEAIVVNGRELYPKGADVIGRVTDVHPTGRLSEPGELDLVLSTVSSGTVAASIHVEPLVIKGDSHAKSNVTKIGGGAALGAVIGAIAGGGKGAAIGTLAGGAAGYRGGRGYRQEAGDCRIGSRPHFCYVHNVGTRDRSAGHRIIERRARLPTTHPLMARRRRPSHRPPILLQFRMHQLHQTTTRRLFTLRDRRTIRNCVS